MTTGAANDIQKATSLAKHMVAVYGMSDALGLMAPAIIQNQYLDGTAQMDCSQQTAAKVDAAVQQMLDTCYAEAKELLASHRAMLDEISQHLLVKETITGDELMQFINADNGDLADADDFVSEEEK